MIDPKRIILGCVVASSNKNYSNLETEYLFLTLNKFGGNTSLVKKWACFVEEPNPLVKEVLKNLGVSIKIVEPLDQRDPYSNKLRLLEESMGEDFDYLVVLDTDILVADDFLSFIDGDSIKAKPVNYDPIGLENWEKLFDHFNLKFPKNRVKTITSGTETIPYFGSGVMIIPKKYVKTIFESCSNFIHLLCDHRDQGKLPQIFSKQKHLNEIICLALSLAKNNLDCSHLPLEMNYSTMKVSEEQNPTFLKPKLIHYHHKIFDNGSIIPCPYENINKTIDKINGFLVKEKKLEVTSSNTLPYITRYFLKEKKYLEVIKRLKDLDIENEDSILQFHLAKAYQEMKNYSDAVLLYSTSLKNNYHTPFSIFLERGSCYLKLKQLINAEKDFKNALKLNPSHRRLKTKLSILEKQKEKT
jgi:hypothetical protein